MPVYMITLHAYRSWSEDNPMGYVQRGEHGIKTPDPILAKQRASLAKNPPRHFTEDQKQFIITQAQEILSNRNIRLHAASCTSTHTHLIVSWFGKEPIFQEIKQPFKQADLLANKVKTVLATLLSKREESTGNRWFSRGCDCTPVNDRDHLNHLLEHYLPKHRHESGIVQAFDKGSTGP
ncbi:MAG: hypothetical protein AAF711_17490 [Planctomycetota bacterium]